MATPKQPMPKDTPLVDRKLATSSSSQAHGPRKIAAAMPKPKDGADGFSLDDFDASLADDGRTLTLTFKRTLRLRFLKSTSDCLA